MTLKQIATDLDISVSTLRRRIAPFSWMFGNHKRKRLYSPEEREVVVKNVK